MKTIIQLLFGSILLTNTALAFNCDSTSSGYMGLGYIPEQESTSQLTQNNNIDLQISTSLDKAYIIEVNDTHTGTFSWSSECRGNFYSHNNQCSKVTFVPAEEFSACKVGLYHSDGYGRLKYVNDYLVPDKILEDTDDFLEIESIGFLRTNEIIIFKALIVSDSVPHSEISEYQWFVNNDSNFFTKTQDANFPAPYTFSSSGTHTVTVKAIGHSGQILATSQKEILIVGSSTGSDYSIDITPKYVFSEIGRRITFDFSVDYDFPLEALTYIIDYGCKFNGVESWSESLEVASSAKGSIGDMWYEPNIAGKHECYAKLSAQGDVNLSNNYVSAFVDVPKPIVDLEIVDVEFPDSITVSGKYNINVKVRNNGETTIGSSQIAAFISDYYDPFYKKWAYQAVLLPFSNLNSGEIRTVSKEIIIANPDYLNSKPDKYFIILGDNQNYLDESNENNNYLVKNITIKGKPDLAHEEFGFIADGSYEDEIHATVGSSVSLYDVISNDSLSSSTATTLKCWASDEQSNIQNGQLLFTKAINPIDSYGLLAITLTVDVIEGKNYVACLIDPDNLVSEQDTSNNLSIPVTIVGEKQIGTKPIISPDSGVYTSPVRVTLSSETEGASLYYTLDGSNPDSSSSLYISPFTLEHSAKVRVIAVADGYENSSITEVQYVIDTTYEVLLQWDESYDGNCHWYGVASGNTTWEEAKTQAENLSYQGVQGHLATITSAEENTFVHNLIKSESFDRYLIGGYQQHKNAEPDGGWAWVNQEPWIYTNWLQGEPSNTPSNEDQLDIRNYDGGWNDIPGEAEYARQANGFIVEFDTGCGDSNTPDKPIVLNLPDTDDHGSYSISWPAVSNTTVTYYELQEALQTDFSDAVRLYAGTNTSHAITGKPAGKYYYRIRACNGSFCGTWQAAPEGLLVSGVCLDVITPAYHPETGEEKDFPTSCIPQDWIAGKAPDFDNDGINDILDEDDDNDGMSDIWEIANGLNSKDATDAESDQDSDGRSNLDEYLAGTDPRDNTSYSTLLISHNNGKTIGNSDVELSTTLYLDNTVVNTLSVSFEYGYTSSLGSVSGDVNSADIIALLLSTGNASNKTIYPAITLSGLETDKTVYYRPKLVLNGKTHLGSISKLVVAGECSYDAWEPLTANTGDPDDTVLDFAYGNGVLVATSFNSLKYSTDNGNSWTAGLSKSHFGYDVIWAGNTFFAIGVSSSSNSVYKSKNGQTWELVHEFSNYDRPSKLAWSGKQLAAAGSGGKIFLSNDGTGWEEHYVGYDGLLEDIEWINNQFEAVGANRLFSSIDGVEWNESFIEIFGGAFGMRVAGNDHSLVVHAANSSDRRIFTKLHGETNWISTTNNYFTNDYLWDGKYYFGASTTYSSSISVDGINWVDKPKLSGSTIFHDGEFIYVNGSNGVIQRSRCDAPKTADVTVKIEHTPAEFQALSLSAKILVTGNNLPSSISIETEGCSPFWSKDTRYDETTDTWTSVCGATTTGTYSGVVKNTLTGEVLADYEFELKYAEPIVTSIKTDPSVIHVGDDVLLTFTGEHLRPNSDMSLDGFENCAYTFGSYAPPAPGSNVTEIKYQCHAVSAGSKQGVINFSEELTHAFSVTVNEPIAIAPSISRITPDSIIRSTSNIEVTIEGDKFTEDSQVYFQVSGRKSKIADADVQFVDAQTLKFPVKPGLAGVWVFQVRNADKVSNSVDFTVTEPIIPVVQSITPEQANMGEITTFTVHGKDLPITLAFWIDGCANISRTNNATSTAVQFKCTPTLAGLRNGEVKTKSGGELLKQFKVNMLDELCPQVISHAYNPTTGEEKDYPTPCDVPQEWITGQAPDNDKDGTNDILDLDDDNDGLPDTWEVQYGLNSLDSNDAALDADNDNLTNLEEFNQGTSPLIANSSTNNATKVMPVILQLLLDE